MMFRRAKVFSRILSSSSSSSSSSSCLNNGRERALSSHSFKSSSSSSSSSSSFPSRALLKPSLKTFSSWSAFRQTTPLLSSASTTTTTRTLLQNNNFIISSAQKKRSYVGVVVEDGNVDRAMRRMKRTMINEKMFDAFKRDSDKDATPGLRNRARRECWR